MMSEFFGPEQRYGVRFDATETKVDVVGNLTIEELDRLIPLLVQARETRDPALESITDSSFTPIPSYWAIKYKNQIKISQLRHRVPGDAFKELWPVASSDPCQTIQSKNLGPDFWDEDEWMHVEVIT